MYDVPIRYEQALDPSALTTIRTTLHAMEKALEDCRNAGVCPDTDPAVVLLARHMATVSTNRRDDDTLRFACTRRLDDLRHFPTILALALRGVDFDAIAKDRFHADGQKAMHDLARVMDLPEGGYEVRSWRGDISISGTVALATHDFVVELAIGGIREGRELTYRAIRGGVRHGKDHYAQILLLVRPERFAARLRRDLKLGPPPAAEPLLLTA
ncbi:hypothetical protein [Sphingomonas solaris]|uniref:Uncharacterized protein n=1 Tax=Alterirhizorhabdus solaris TaxID=2529389 RepID=A0A558RCK6_9SPHN|nr:hypothetical protein [Sphingomonas solaris]TVV76972.1 hypothetical protein FOY91_02715 [Sphingomonas solaris]